MTVSSNVPSAEVFEALTQLFQPSTPLKQTLLARRQKKLECIKGAKTQADLNAALTHMKTAVELVLMALNGLEEENNPEGKQLQGSIGGIHERFYVKNLTENVLLDEVKQRQKDKEIYVDQSKTTDLRTTLLLELKNKLEEMRKDSSSDDDTTPGHTK